MPAILLLPFLSVSLSTGFSLCIPAIFLLPFLSLSLSVGFSLRMPAILLLSSSVAFPFCQFLPVCRSLCRLLSCPLLSILSSFVDLCSFCTPSILLPLSLPMSAVAKRAPFKHTDRSNNRRTTRPLRSSRCSQRPYQAMSGIQSACP